MIEISSLSKEFSVNGKQFRALDDVSISIGKGEIFGVIGMSGAGKSTLVRTINMLERPSGGTVRVNGKDMASLTPAQLNVERRNISMIFQGFNLLMQRTCLENILFPLELAGWKREKALARAEELIGTVGLPEKVHAYPSQLSGGQKQRIAIARALALDPKILLCDEATSALDPKTTHSILALIRDINKRLGITVVVITHQMSVVEEICDRVAILERGKVVEQGLVSEIFAHPSSEAAKRLVFPDGGAVDMKSLPTEHIIRVVFRGSETANAPLITQMAIDEHIAANIRYASTRCIGDKVYGIMLLGLPKDSETIARAKRYLSRENAAGVEDL